MTFLDQIPVFFKFLAAFSLAGGVTWALVPFVIHFAHVLGFIDEPDARRVHENPTPRGGGIAVFVGVQIALALELFVFAPNEGRETIDQRWWLAFILASSFLVLVGLLDDRFGISAKVKLVAQSVSALIFIFISGSTIGSLFGIELHPVLDVLVSLFWVITLINAFNLIDGMDGLCSGLALISAVGLGLAAASDGWSVEAVVPLAVGGACLGFLFYNFHPAKIFLGDTGSMFLGFSLAVIALPSNKTTLAFSMGMPLMVAGIPLFDTILAFWRRWIRKTLSKTGSDGESVKIFGADKEHLHHRILSLGLSQRRTAMLLYGVASSVTLIMLAAMIFRQNAYVVYMLGFSLFVYVVVKHVAMTELWDTGMAITYRLSRFSGKTRVLFGYLFWDLACITFAALATTFIFPVHGGGFDFLDSIGYLVVPMTCVFGMLVVAQAYQRVWSRAGLRDFAALQMGFVFSGVIFFAYEAVRVEAFSGAVIGRVFVFTALANSGIMCGRVILQYIRVMMMTASEHEMHESSAYARRAVVYGASKGCQTLLRDRYFMDPHMATLRRIIGIIDPDLGIRGKLMKGVRIMGDIDEIPAIYKKFNIHEIIVTQDTSPEERRKLMEFSRLFEIDVYEWATSLRPYEGNYPATFLQEQTRKVRMMEGADA